MINIQNRNSITNLLNENSIGCELGVFEGEFSEILWSSKKFNQLYLVDIFYGATSNFGKHCQDASILEKIVKDRFKYIPQIHVIKQNSINFLTNCTTEFDFMYIDTVHTYDHLIQELMLSYKLIKDKGYLCGHDYSLRYFPGVVKAVEDFCNKMDLQPHITTDIEDYPSFYIQINK